MRPEDGQEEITTVSDFIVREISEDELDFEQEACAKIFEEFRFHSEQGIFPGDKHFVLHPDPDISGLSTSLLAESHELSRIWKDKQTYVETEEMKLKELVPDSVLKFKSDKIKFILKDIMAQLEEAVKEGDMEKVVALQKKDLHLKSALRMISGKLGNRILL